VIGAAQRKGNVVARVIENTDTDTLDGFVRQAVSEKVSLIVSDEHAGYRKLGDDFDHRFVRHSVGRYVDGVVHTQTIDGFWSLLKRGVMGAYHKGQPQVSAAMSRNSTSVTTIGTILTSSGLLWLNARNGRPYGCSSFYRKCA
jgi:hypothetical protein